MKKQKILLFGIAIALVLILASCSGVPHDGGCFEFEGKKVYADVTSFDGKVLSYNAEHNFVALESLEHSADGSVKDIVKVIDLMTGKTVFESIDYLENGETRQGIAVDLSSYPLIKLGYQEKVYVDGEPVEKCYTDIYRIKHETDGYSTEYMAGRVENDNSVSYPIANAYILCVGDKVVWVGADLEVLRELPGGVHNSYVYGDAEDFFGITAEYKGFLYAWEFKDESRMAVVYGPDGMATAKYSFSSGAVVMKDESGKMLDTPVNPSLFVLDNGNVLVQECIADEENYDFIYLGYKLRLRTAVMDFRDGTVSELECKFLIERLESYYDGEYAKSSAFPLKLASRYENQAYVIDIVNSMLSTNERYVVLDNEAEICYELKNEYLAAEHAYGTITDADKDGYIATATVYGVKAQHRFNYNGDVIYTRPTGYRGETDNLYCTNSGIYTKSGDLKFDIAKSDFNGNYLFDIYVLGNCIALEKLNYDTGAVDTYVYDEDAGEPVPVADGRYCVINYTEGHSLYTVYDDDKGVTTVYNLKGEIVAKIAGVADVSFCNDAAFIELEISGDSLIYVITAQNDAEEE